MGAVMGKTSESELFVWSKSPPGSLERYRGCMTAALIGDCIGSCFHIPPKPSVSLSDILEEVDTAHKDGLILDYSDDTAMCHALAISLIRCKGIDAKDLAKEFRDRYFLDAKRRPYGAHIPKCLHAWKDEMEDVFQPSRTQFDGQGSHGNGGAMRTAPIPLLYYNDSAAMLQVAKEAAQLTHFHAEGYEGAMLLSYAIHLALHAKDQADMEPQAFMEKLIQCCREHFYNGQSEVPDLHQILLKRAKKLLLQRNPSPQLIIQTLGHSIRAVESVTTAIYCALVAYRPINGIKSENPLERTILYAISLGGDCDTIATMAGAVSGAFYGYAAIPKKWITICEGMEDAETIARQLHNTRQ